MRQEDAQRGSLDRVEPRVRPYKLVRALVERPVEAEHPQAIGDALVGARHETAVAEREEVLRRKEAEGRANAGCGDAGGAERLRSVLDQGEAESGEGGKRRGPTEEMHGHD